MPESLHSAMLLSYNDVDLACELSMITVGWSQPDRLTCGHSPQDYAYEFKCYAIMADSELMHVSPNSLFSFQMWAPWLCLGPGGRIANIKTPGLYVIAKSRGQEGLKQNPKGNTFSMAVSLTRKQTLTFGAGYSRSSHHWSNLLDWRRCCIVVLVSVSHQANPSTGHNWCREDAVKPRCACGLTFAWTRTDS